MGQYTRTSPSGAITSAYINSELGKIADAHNTHATGDFGAGVVPNSALATPNSIMCLQLNVESVGVGQADVKFDQVVIPAGCTLMSAKVVCSAVSANASIDIHELSSAGVDAGSIISGASQAIAAANTVYTPTLTVTEFVSGEQLALYATTDGAGTLTDLNVTLKFKLRLV